MKILIADDHGIVRGGLRLLIERQADMEVVAEADDGVAAFEQALATRPDLCVLDVSMPRMTGLQAARQIRAHLPDTQVLALSMHDDERYVFDALKAGASGYVLKREVDQALLNAIRAVHRGDAFLTNAVERSLIREWMSDDSSGPEEPLSPREQEVLKLIAEAHTNKQIAEILHLAEKTVESHRANLLRKLGMRDRVELVRYAIRRGLTEAGADAMARRVRQASAVVTSQLLHPSRRLSGHAGQREFEAIYDRHHAALFGFCRHMLGSREEAEDALQQVFVAAYRELQAGREPEHLRAWLYAIARNRCVSMLRARRDDLAAAA